jgi:hypothetical protein
MSQSSPAKIPPKGDQPVAAPVVEPGFEEHLHKFWEKNRNGVLMVCVAAVLAIAVREGWQYFADQRENSIQQDYARLGDRTDGLAAFAEANPDHVLAGVAWLRLADDNFEKADYKAAAANYLKAAGKLKNEELISRARLGAGMSLLAGGDNSGGEAALKALGADQTATKDVRSEATYHLASLAAAAGKVDEVKKLVEELDKIDATGTWSQRGMMLLATTPGAGAGQPAAQPATTIKFNPGG